MSSEATATIPPDSPEEAARKEKAVRRWKRWRRIRRCIGVLIVLLMIGGVIGRYYLGSWVTWYVNRVIDQNTLYDGKIESVDLQLYKGTYSIHGIKLLKRTGNVSAPFFEADRLDIAVDWNALLHRQVKATAHVERPKINFVQGRTEGDSQDGSTGGGGPWLRILRDLAPFDINSATVHQGEVHFVNRYASPPVDVFLNRLDLRVKNVSNIEDKTNPLNASVDLTGRAMESGDLECHVKFDPFSYKPTFQLALRLLRLDVSKLNDFTKAYGDFDFESGYFDLVIELNSKEGILDGYTKPLFRDVQILGRRDFRSENVFNIFWQALLGTGEFVLRNQPRGQFGTNIPISGILETPKVDALTTILNVLRNAFVRAYVPRLEGRAPDVDGLQFKAGDITQPGSAATQ